MRSGNLSSSGRPACLGGAVLLLLDRDRGFQLSRDRGAFVRAQAGNAAASVGRRFLREHCIERAIKLGLLSDEPL
jgi:hypothetical protein